MRGFYTSRVQDWSSMLLAATAVLFIGLSKAGFGGGLGMLTTPLCVLAFGAKDAIGILLPLLCAGDAFSVYHYWGRWERKNLKFLLPGVVVGVVIGVQLIGRFSARELNVCIGLLAVAFVVFQLVKERIFAAEGAFAPDHKIGIPCGIGAGITSTFAHGAGPVVSLFLIPQRMPKETYVATTVLVFTCINWIKMPFFVVDREMVDLPVFAPHAIITAQTLQQSIVFLPFIPVGVWLGVWLNRKFSEQVFLKVVYAMTFLTGLQLIFNFNPAKWLR
ncbi:MAG: sulfite exporter TauE/SafE family protein [Verrucomicrobia bacterium]|nr:sulfite exporter TauE/SafE family protein [Verrucomicrobiota bacterium]